MSIVRLTFIIATIFGSIASFALIWIGMDMLGLPGWTSVVLVVCVFWWLGRALERFTRPQNTPDHHQYPSAFARPRQDRRSSLD